MGDGREKNETGGNRENREKEMGPVCFLRFLLFIFPSYTGETCFAPFDAVKLPSRDFRFSAMSFKSAFCGSANFLIPSDIKVSSSFLISTRRSISASTSAGGIWSTWDVIIRPEASTSSLVAGGLVSMSEPAKASTYFQWGSSGFFVPVLANI